MQLIENQGIASFLPSDFDASSRLWFYVSDRALSSADQAVCRERLDDFLPRWTAHNRSLKAFGGVLFDRILAIAVDETQAGASGCGIDKSVHFVEELGAALGIDFFDRTTVGLASSASGLEFLPFQKAAERLRNDEASSGALLLDTTVLTKADFESDFLKPVSKSWLARFV